MKAAIYARYSSDNQREESIDAQIRAIKEYCIKNNIEVVKIYTDEALSGKSDKRPSFLQMVEDSKNKIFDVAIIHKLDRFSRNRYDAAIYKKKLKDNGVKLISVLENIDDSPESIIMESVLMGMAEYYSANLSREVMKGMRETAYQAKHNGGKPPLGYTVTLDKSYAINEPEAEIVREIYRMNLAGYGYTFIAKTLNDKKTVTGLSRSFSKISIRDILMNEKYIGTYVFNRRADGKTLHKIKPEEEIIRIPDALPAIIDKISFELVQKKFKEGKRGSVVRKEYYLLTGKIFCGECESSYTGIGYVGRQKYYQYGCTGRKKNKSCTNKPIRKEPVENYIINSLKEEIFNVEKMPIMAKELAEKIKAYTNIHEKEILSTQKSVKEIENKINKFFDLYLEEGISKELLANKTNILKVDLDFEKEKLINLETKNYQKFDENKVLRYLQHCKTLLESDEPENHRKVILEFVQKINIYPDTIDYDFIIKSTDSDRVNGGEPCLTISLSVTKEDVFNS